MNEPSANPVIVGLLFILRCLIPLAILFGISYLFRRLGLVAESPPEPPDLPGEKDEDETDLRKNEKES